MSVGSISLDGALSIASSGIANISAQLALVSHNVANASTPDYAVEIGNQQSVSAGGIGMGVATDPATRATDAALQASLLGQNAAVSGLQTQQTAMQAIASVQGTPGQGQDLASMLGNLQDAFSTLLTDPSNAAQQSAVVSAAGTLVQGINTLSSAYTQQRQAAQDAIVSEVKTINTSLGAIGQLSDQIVGAKAAGQSTADLENQRDAQISSLSQLLDVKVLPQSNGDVLITTSTGTVLPTHTPDPLSTADANVQPAASYSGGTIPPITMGGMDITGALQGGTIGANLTLRDQTLPTYQGELDEFAQNLASRFSAQGLALFTDASGNVPAGGGTPPQNGYVGFSAIIQINPAVQTNPALVRDGTAAIAGSATGASAFTPNPAGGPAGFSTMIARVLNYALGADVQPGVVQPGSNVTGLGQNGNLNAPYGAQPTLSGIASTMLASQAADANTAQTQLGTEQAVQSTLQNTLTNETGVSLDTEMSQMIALQNAYGANAKVISAAQSLFSTLIGMVSTP